MNNKYTILLVLMLVLISIQAIADGDRNVSEVKNIEQAQQWLKDKARQMIRASVRVAKGDVNAFPPQVNSGYEAFWLRDYSYMLEGCITAFTDKELKDAYNFFLNGQREDGAMVDCIKFDGTPIYQPGYGTMGENPVADGSQFTVNVAYKTYQKTKDKDLLKSTIGKLNKGMNAIPINRDTGLVFIDPAKDYDRCPYGFTDSVRKQGDVFFESLLYIQASERLSQLYRAIGIKGEAKVWRDKAKRTANSVNEIFWDSKTGLYRTATVKCKEHDIWGSAFAVYLGVADQQKSNAIAEYFVQHYDGIVKRGQLRHLPAGVYWEQAGARDVYQNGAYWATPVGWFVYTLDLKSPELADKTVVDMVNDFIKTGDVNECINDGYSNVPQYIDSAALPIDGIAKMLSGRKK